MQADDHSGPDRPNLPHQHTHTASSVGVNPNSRFNWNVHHPFDGIEDRVAVEVAPWSGLLPRWRFVVPADFKRVVRWGIGTAGGADLGPAATLGRVHQENVQLLNGPMVDWMGGHNPLSKKLSAFLVFEGDPPHFLAFGQADEIDGPPTNLEGIYFAGHPPPHTAHD